MHYTKSFHIALLDDKDAKNLNELMVSNAERFKRYFPKTLSSNLTLEDSERYIIAKALELQSNESYTFAIKEKATENIAGLIIVKKIDFETRQAELAYGIGAQYEGKGLVTFAVKEVSNFAFNELNLKTLQIISHKTNLGSVKVAVKSGFVWQRTLPDEFTPTNELPLDMELYELTK
ncbi:GNAT family N-acetyltransferase [Flavobacterium sp. ZT3R18]|uniref:GNAT family N-acetyltransferase n=1 Tax=Flavobacterium sp. ZT3R18 TaxID=2594429 RepID=UPI001179E0B1|nr:GNAT family N-acetyltransferase [Flavobacterium sp. ZT3R18]TRX32053.1 GNAT family N-acetyltransferase [Flavobacterium sp. ZT3R18]